ncbi:hypothetical protein OPT61_g3783 [Boeremia exigua]|uniref:Uncharacterized protein n=1 Tax=Boeremia exigua TaxID=749465 RepID=A0ACC2IGG2_9PLEO|nr:hypothetical protein OPT61_g3783 [Boeremia exigua]
MKGLRHFSTSVKKLFEWRGLDIKALPAEWRDRMVDISSPGGAAEKAMGAPLQSIEILYRQGVAVHYSGMDRECKEEVISIHVEGANGTKRCHVMPDGALTTKKGGEKFY